jgi:hypothetical protein
MKVKRLLSISVLALSPALLLGVVGASSASASASGFGDHVSISVACNTLSAQQCQSLGGEHGELHFNADGTMTFNLTDTSHLLGGGPGAGSAHLAGTVAALNGQSGWFIGPDGTFWITNETVTFTEADGSSFTIADPFPPYPHSTNLPAFPGHYTAETLFGFSPPPGFSFQVEVS